MTTVFEWSQCGQEKYVSLYEMLLVHFICIAAELETNFKINLQHKDGET